jgi:tol-pal system protein YbgF
VSELIDQVEVLNARIKKMESGEGLVQQAAARPAESQARPPVRQPAQTQTRPPVTAAPAARPSPAISPASVTDRYREALVLFGKGQINDSRAMFQQVFDADPNGDLADNALFWVGETYFVSGRYREAIEQYRRIETDFSNQNKAPDALLQLGLAQAKLGDLALAQRTLEGLINRYPYSTAANAAKAEIKRLRY